MISVLLSLLLTLRGWAHSHAALQLEVLALRHQRQVLHRARSPRFRLTAADRLLWVWLARVWNNWRPALVIVKPETVLAWHRRGFRLLWTWKSRRRTGRPTVPSDVRALIRTMSRANPLWGAPRIHGELLKLGIDVCQATVAKYMVRPRRPPSQTWHTFLANHIGQVMAADFFVVPTATCRLLFVLVILAHERRRVVHVAVTEHPTAAWTAQQLREAFPWNRAAISPAGSRSRVPRLGEHDDSDGYPGSAHGAALTLAERVRRTVHRLRATRVSRSRPRVQRHRTPAADEALLRLLRTITHSPVAEQGRADPSPDLGAGRWSRRGDPAGRRASSSVRVAGA
jgi:putative transposase